MTNTKNNESIKDLCHKVQTLVGVNKSEGDDIRVIVEIALEEDPAATAEDIAETVLEARAEALST